MKEIGAGEYEASLAQSKCGRKGRNIIYTCDVQNTASSYVAKSGVETFPRKTEEDRQGKTKITSMGAAQVKSRQVYGKGFDGTARGRRRTGPCPKAFASSNARRAQPSTQGDQRAGGQAPGMLLRSIPSSGTPPQARLHGRVAPHEEFHSYGRYQQLDEDDACAGQRDGSLSGAASCRGERKIEGTAKGKRRNQRRGRTAALNNQPELPAPQSPTLDEKVGLRDRTDREDDVMLLPK
ncbi:hypothetical protein B0H19DRAFT_1075857 [Mycena capillaripes]|nr:hypothetical protein B0H19DRAFT_1075857 [Mycena capillaripes]